MNNYEKRDKYAVLMSKLKNLLMRNITMKLFLLNMQY